MHDISLKTPYFLSATLTFKPSQSFILGIVIGIIIIAVILMVRRYLAATSKLRKIESKREIFKNHFYQFLDVFPVGILGLSQTGEILLRNYSVKLLTGIETQGLKDIKDMNCFTESQLEWLIHQIQQPGPNREMQVQIKTTTGIKMLLISVNVPFDQDPDLPSAYVLIQDQTKEKSMGALLQQQDKIEKMNQLSAGVVHELKNPLSSIKGYIQMLDRRLDDPSFVKLAMSVLPVEIDRLIVMVESMLNYAKPNALKKELFNLKKLVEDVSRFFKIEMSSHRIQLKTELEDTLVFSSVNGIRQVLINVLFNAVEAMPAGGIIDISLKQEGSCILLLVHDNGSGMTQDQLERLLEPYYTTKENGSGMGIPVSNQIISELGGQLRFESILGAGTTVIIEIPSVSSEEGV
jgi:signal transduction histidine kinase